MCRPNFWTVPIHQKSDHILLLLVHTELGRGGPWQQEALALAFTKRRMPGEEIVVPRKKMLVLLLLALLEENAAKSFTRAPSRAACVAPPVVEPDPPYFLSSSVEERPYSVNEW
jgi:hypothetical protein